MAWCTVVSSTTTRHSHKKPARRTYDGKCDKYKQGSKIILAINKDLTVIRDHDPVDQVPVLRKRGDDLEGAEV